MLKPAARRVKMKYRHWKTDSYVVSYPKSGRTWLRVMTARVMAEYADVGADTRLTEPSAVAALSPGIPWVTFSHDGSDRPLAVDLRTRAARRRRYASKRVLLLARDPRDVVVSWYFHRTRRKGEEHDLSAFLRHPDYGIMRTIEFLNRWREQAGAVAAFGVVRYEDLHADCGAALTRALEVMGLPLEGRPDIIESAAEFARIDNLRRIAATSADPRLVATDPGDPESHKTRRGKVGGYADYLTEDDIAYADDCMTRLHPSYGYSQGARLVR